MGQEPGSAVQVRDTEILPRARAVAEVEDEPNFRKKPVSIDGSLKKKRVQKC